MSSLTFFKVLLFFLLIINLCEATPLKKEAVPEKMLTNADLNLANSGLQLLAKAAEKVDELQKFSRHQQLPFDFSPIKMPSSDQVKQNHKRRRESIPRLLEYKLTNNAEKASEQLPFGFSPIKMPSSDQVKQNHKRRRKSIPRLLEFELTNNPRTISPIADEFNS